MSLHALLARADSSALLLGITAALLVLPHFRAGQYLIYPLSFLATWFHEMGHVIATLLVGGEVEKVALFPNLSGRAITRRPNTTFAAFLNPALGLLGPSIAGGLIVYFGGRPPGPRWILIGTGAALILSALIWVRNPFGFFFAVLIGIGLIQVPALTSGLTTFWLTQALGIRLAIESLSDFSYLFSRQAEEGASDTQLLARSLCCPHWIWGLLIGAMSLAILVTSFYWTWGALLPGAT